MRPWMTLGAVLGTEKRQFLQKKKYYRGAGNHTRRFEQFYRPLEIWLTKMRRRFLGWHKILKVKKL